MGARFLQALGGGSSLAAFSVISDSEWGSLNDASSRVTSSTKESDGTITMVMAGDTTQTDGYQEDYAGFDVLLTDLYSDWDDSTDVLQLYVDIASMPLTSAKYGIFAGVSDDTYANRGTQDFTGGGVFPNTATVTQSFQSGAAANAAAVNNGGNTDVPVGFLLTISFDADGQSRVVVQADLSVSGLQQGTVAGAAGATLGSVANRRVVVGHTHVSATSGTPTLAFRVYHRRFRGAVRSAPALQDKPASISTMLIVGHSIANGVGDSDTTYGGAAIGGTGTHRDSGSTITNYPNNAGAGPDPGVWPYWVADQSAANIIRQSTNGQILAGLETTELPDIVADCTALSIDRSTVDLVVMMIGENDAQNSTESGNYAARLDHTMQLYEGAFPNARIIIQDMVTEDAAYSEFAAIRAANAAAVALNPTRRALAARTSITLADAVHYDLSGYAQAAANQIAAWDAM